MGWADCPMKPYGEVSLGVLFSCKRSAGCGENFAVALSYGVVCDSCSVDSHSTDSTRTQLLRLFVARQAPLPVKFSRQEHWSG